ncbi:hypothetical protein NIES267_35300 [Calothrix parasitica NIES-267]|uniref:Uncharacterized protein n=1 Tax=Calothrix parasitica NIES-267 TaxID=1973488 RepID=A0A1Z4LS13_9CYAN|nr:hypothetical protein NIES267_35300 [Calothrix parasitica NIES-267]
MTGNRFNLKTMKKIGSDYQDLAEETPLNVMVVPVKTDLKLITDICEKNV